MGKGRFAPEPLWALQSCEVTDLSAYKVHGEIKPGMCFVIHAYSVDAEAREGSSSPIGGQTIGDSFIVTEDGNECLSKLPLEITIV